jgi:hypothetical protein
MITEYLQEKIMVLYQQFLILLITLLVYSSGVLAKTPDWKAYADILKTVKQGEKNGVELTLVDYQTLKNNGQMEAVYQVISAFPVESLDSPNEKLAFYINSYNILAIKMVLDHWPEESIKDSGSFFNPVWDKPAGKIGGKTVTLGEIEHEILRPMGEPRIHMAIVCASVSCPDLRNEPYTAEQLNTQLNEQTSLFLNNTGKGLRTGEQAIQTSKIFDWFGEDFQPVGGVDTFIRSYRSGLPEKKIKANLPYDWNINGIVTD